MLTQPILYQPADLAFLDDFALYIQNRGIGNDGRHQPMPNMLWWCEASPHCSNNCHNTLIGLSFKTMGITCTFFTLTCFNSFTNEVVR